MFSSLKISDRAIAKSCGRNKNNDHKKKKNRVILINIIIILMMMIMIVILIMMSTIITIITIITKGVLDGHRPGVGGVRLAEHARQGGERCVYLNIM